MSDVVDGVRTALHDDVLEVTLASPDVRNAQTPGTWRRLASIPDELTPEVRFVVLRGEGPSFSAGLDRRMLTPEGVPGEPSLLDLSQQDADTMDGFIQQAQAAFTWWARIPQVSIALVQGHAIGAGFQLALACDVMIVAPDVKLAMRETSLGLVPDLGGTGPLLDRVGYSRALEICATGRFVGSDEAVRLGLALRAVPQEDWDIALDEMLTPMRAAMPSAVAELKTLLRGASGAVDQLARERESQVRRLTELGALLTPTEGTS
ncbi:MAG: enoyl-CoA hydratase/isomerase family protein [Candidatus Nanopelagicales bacterium]|nr:enoyl-CoA hydratase/isomerase family protein [Candidatus Nanopelagicales bacterium]MCF8536614.1 enoyl-CoA hydratase/isomerase family protein [Candidatus Nanopelagicales bacterium]MCF8541647.1 enoyl-CoA hydratase/isomerase family protein [Candidatus Nanopelagicales bacterium]MCF8556281.1 enoyl-CoA hydratase/isomerase family protein [Candidatus Nanopelagicales bacterium]